MSCLPPPSEGLPPAFLIVKSNPSRLLRIVEKTQKYVAYNMTEKGGPQPTANSGESVTSKQNEKPFYSTNIVRDLAILQNELNFKGSCTDVVCGKITVPRSIKSEEVLAKLYTDQYMHQYKYYCCPNREEEEEEGEPQRVTSRVGSLSEAYCTYVSKLIPSSTVPFLQQRVQHRDLRGPTSNDTNIPIRPILSASEYYRRIDSKSTANEREKKSETDTPVTTRSGENCDYGTQNQKDESENSYYRVDVCFPMDIDTATTLEYSLDASSFGLEGAGTVNDLTYRSSKESHLLPTEESNADVRIPLKLLQFDFPEARARILEAFCGQNTAPSPSKASSDDSHPHQQQQQQQEYDIIYKPYKFIIYAEGDFFLPHADSMNDLRQIGSLVVQVPMEDEGYDDDDDDEEDDQQEEGGGNGEDGDDDDHDSIRDEYGGERKPRTKTEKRIYRRCVFGDNYGSSNDSLVAYKQRKDVNGEDKEDDKREEKPANPPHQRQQQPQHQRYKTIGSLCQKERIIKARSDSSKGSNVSGNLVFYLGRHTRQEQQARGALDHIVRLGEEEEEEEEKAQPPANNQDGDENTNELHLDDDNNNKSNGTVVASNDRFVYEVFGDNQHYFNNSLTGQYAYKLPVKPKDELKLVVDLTTHLQQPTCDQIEKEMMMVLGGNTEQKMEQRQEVNTTPRATPTSIIAQNDSEVQSSSSSAAAATPSSVARCIVDNTYKVKYAAWLGDIIHEVTRVQTRHRAVLLYRLYRVPIKKKKNKNGNKSEGKFPARYDGNPENGHTISSNSNANDDATDDEAEALRASLLGPLATRYISRRNHTNKHTMLYTGGGNQTCPSPFIHNNGTFTFVSRMNINREHPREKELRQLAARMGRRGGGNTTNSDASSPSDPPPIRIRTEVITRPIQPLMCSGLHPTRDARLLRCGPLLDGIMKAITLSGSPLHGPQVNWFRDQLVATMQKKGKGGNQQKQQDFLLPPPEARLLSNVQRLRDSITVQDAPLYLGIILRHAYPPAALVPEGLKGVDAALYHIVARSAQLGYRVTLHSGYELREDYSSVPYRAEFRSFDRRWEESGENDDIPHHQDAASAAAASGGIARQVYLTRERFIEDDLDSWRQNDREEKEDRKTPNDHQETCTAADRNFLPQFIDEEAILDRDPSRQHGAPLDKYPAFIRGLWMQLGHGRLVTGGHTYGNVDCGVDWWYRSAVMIIHPEPSLWKRRMPLFLVCLRGDSEAFRRVIEVPDVFLYIMSFM